MIHCRVQGHPSRNALHERILRLLAPLQTELFLHQSDPPNPWENYRRCLDYGGAASHLLIVQDDAIPCEGFADAATKVAFKHPDTPVCLFVGALPASTATRIRRAKPDVRYVPLTQSSFMPLVCVLWPTHLARAFLLWSETGARITRADDGNAARWLRSTRQQVMVTVPSLVEHDDFTPSVKGGRDHVPGAESWRRALFLAANGSEHDW